MAIPTQAYWYNDQLKRYIIQFLTVFSGLQVSIGKTEGVNEPTLIPVTIHYGNHDRVVASLMAENTQNKPIRLPCMTAYMQNIELAPDLMHGTGAERRRSYVPTGGLLPDDVQVVHQRMPVPYRMNCQLGIYASNTDQHFQILEQVLMLFDPQLTIQSSDAPFDWTRLTTVKLTGVSIDQQHPLGTDRRIIQSTLMFDVPVYLGSPADMRRDFIKTINLRLGTLNNLDMEPADIIAALDAMGINYTEIANGADIGFV